MWRPFRPTSIPMAFCGSSTVRTCKHTARARSNFFIRPRTRAREIRCPPRRILSLRPSPMERCLWRPGRIWWFMDYFRLYSRWRETTQTAIVNTVLPVALKIKAVDPYSGQPFSGVTVTFGDGGKGGTFSTTTPVTDGNGFASTIYTLSKVARTVTITASVPGFAGTALTDTGTPAAPKWIVPLKGNNQSATVTTQLPAPLVVKVADQYSNGVPGITVNFNDGGAGGKLSPTSAVTDSLGRAATLYTTSTKAALLTINASALALTLRMHETATAGPAANLAAV